MSSCSGSEAADFETGSFVVEVFVLVDRVVGGQWRINEYKVVMFLLGKFYYALKVVVVRVWGDKMSRTEDFRNGIVRPEKS